MESFREKTAEKKAVYRWKNGMGTEMCRTGTADPEDGAKSEYRKYQEITLTPVEKAYLESIKEVSKEVKRR